MSSQKSLRPALLCASVVFSFSSMCLEMLQNRCLSILWFTRALIPYAGQILVFSLDLTYFPLCLADILQSVYRYVVLSSFIIDKVSFSGFACMFLFW